MPIPGGRRTRWRRSRRRSVADGLGYDAGSACTPPKPRRSRRRSHALGSHGREPSRAPTIRWPGHWPRLSLSRARRPPVVGGRCKRYRPMPAPARAGAPGLTPLGAWTVTDCGGPRMLNHPRHWGLPLLQLERRAHHCDAALAARPGDRDVPRGTSQGCAIPRFGLTREQHAAGARSARAETVAGHADWRARWFDESRASHD